jgi:hypothetical protein
VLLVPVSCLEGGHCRAVLHQQLHAYLYICVRSFCVINSRDRDFGLCAVSHLSSISNAAKNLRELKKSMGVDGRVDGWTSSRTGIFVVGLPPWRDGQVGSRCHPFDMADFFVPYFLSASCANDTTKLP